MKKSYKKHGQPVQPVTLPEPVDVRKAKRLPMFGPGIVITVPLGLWPAYYELYNLSGFTRSTKPGVDLFVKRMTHE